VKFHKFITYSYIHKNVAGPLIVFAYITKFIASFSGDHALIPHVQRTTDHIYSYMTQKKIIVFPTETIYEEVYEYRPILAREVSTSSFRACNLIF